MFNLTSYQYKKEDVFNCISNYSWFNKETKLLLFLCFVNSTPEWNLGKQQIKSSFLMAGPLRSYPPPSPELNGRWNLETKLK